MRIISGKPDDTTEGKASKVEKIDDKSKKEQATDGGAKTPEPRWIETSDGQIEIEDPDDYLIYLEDILKRIHR